MQRIRAYSVELVLVGILLAAVFFFGYLGYGLLRPEIIDEPFSGEKARANVARQLEFGVRSTGAEGNQRTGDWLIEQLRVLGWDVVIQPITIGDTLTGRNIIGIRSPGQAGAPVALLATHYDTRLAADADPDPAQQMQPTPGANANAAGVAVLVELARTLDVDATGHTICLAFFDAEANSGLPGWSPHMGSQIFRRQPAGERAALRCAAVCRGSGPGGCGGPGLLSERHRRPHAARRPVANGRGAGLERHLPGRDQTAAGGLSHALRRGASRYDPHFRRRLSLCRHHAGYAGTGQRGHPG
jgi:hypothetical protein